MTIHLRVGRPNTTKGATGTARSHEVPDGVDTTHNRAVLYWAMVRLRAGARRLLTEAASAMKET